MVDDHDYIARFSPLTAARFALAIFAKMRSVAELGLTGVDRSEYGKGLRSIAYRERVIFFRIRGNELIVVRVLHGHQDISSDFFKTDEN